MYFGRSLLVAVALGAVLGEARAKDFADRNAPDVFREEIAPLLTPLEAVKEAKEETDRAVTCLLKETIHFVTDDERRFLVNHEIYLVNNQQGVEHLKEAHASYEAGTRKLWLPVARTLSQDGEERQVKENAAFISSSDGASYDSLYEDSATLTIVFPKVEVGSITQRVIVYEVVTEEVPGEFLAMVSLARYSSCHKWRTIVELPQAMAERLKITALGNVPKEVVSAQGEGRKRWEWTATDVDALEYNVGRPPISKIGPALHLGTWHHWDQLAEWYHGLCQSRRTVKEPLQQKLAEWTEGVTDRRELLSILLEKAAAKVRYTGLEFGISRLQPYDCNEVWENQYGDCKDKSNLLRSLLAAKGVHSYMVLVNTNGGGFVNRSIPDWRHFNHAILAVEDGEGGYLFCDPTVEFAPAGVLPLGDSDRDVLLVKGKKAAWVRTPPHEPGRVDADVDLTMEADGRISGWVEMAATGYASWLHRSLRAVDKDEDRRRQAGYYVSFMGPGLTVADLKIEEKQEEGSFRFRAYVDLPSREAVSGAERFLGLPFSGIGLPYVRVAEGVVRKWPLEIEASHRTLKGTIKLPEGWQVVELPDPLAAKGEHFKVSLSWDSEAEKGEIHPLAEISVERATIAPNEINAFAEKIGGVRAWLRERVKVAPASEGALRNAQRKRLTNFPRLSSGRGQLALVDSRYPVDGNLTLRRAALEKVVEWFTGDRQVVFLAESSLSEVDINEGKFEEGAKRLKAPLEGARRDIGAEEYALAEYLYALCLNNLPDQKEEAIKLWVGQAEDKALSNYRRVWSAMMAGVALRDTERFAEIPPLLTPLLPHEGAVEYALSTVLAWAHAELGETDRIRAFLQDLKGGENQFVFRSSFQAVASATAEMGDEGRAKVMVLLEELEVGDEDHSWREQVLAEVRSLIGVVPYCRIAKEKIVDYVKEHRDELDCFALDIAEGVRTREQFQAEFARAQQRRMPKLGIRWSLEALMAIEPDDAYSRDILIAQQFLNWSLQALAKEDAYAHLLEFLLGVTDGLPKGHVHWTNGRFARIAYLKTYQMHDEVKKVLLELSQLEVNGVNKEPFVWAELGECHERSGARKEAIACYEKILSLEKEAGESGNGLMRLFFLHLEDGNQEAALETLDVLGRLSPAVHRQSSFFQTIRELSELRQEKKLKDYWDKMKVWWAEWEDLAKSVGVQDVHGRVPSEGELLEVDQVRRNSVQLGSKQYMGSLRPFVSGARWIPSRFQYLVTTALSVPQVDSLRAQQAQQFVLSVIRSYPNRTDEVGRLCYLWEVGVCFDLEEFEKVEEVAEKFFSTHKGKPDSSYYTLAGLVCRAAKATGNERARVAERFVAIYKDDLVPSRVSPGGLLHGLDLLDALERSDDMLLILKTELSSAAVKANPRLETFLQGKLRDLEEKMKGGGGDATAFAQFRAKWLEEHTPRWISFAKAEKHEDYELRFSRRSKSYQRAEHAKYLIERSGDEGVELDLRQAALLGCLRQIGHFMKLEDRPKFFESLLQAETLPVELRRRELHLLGVEDSTNASHQLGKDFFVNHPLLKGEEQRVARERLGGEFLAENRPERKNLDEAVQHVRESLERTELQGSQLFTLVAVVRRLYGVDRADEAEELIALADQANLGSDLSRTELKLTFLRLREAAKREGVVMKPLQKLIAEELPEEWSRAKKLAVENEAKLLDGVYGDVLDEEQFSYALQLLVLGLDPLTVPGLLLSASNAYEKEGAVLMKVAELSVNLIDDDRKRSRLLAALQRFLDIDAPEHRKRYREISQPYRHPRKHPECYGITRSWELQVALRLGKPVDWRADHSAAENASPLLFLRAKISDLIRKSDKELLGRILDEEDLEILLSEFMIDLTIRALRVTGRQAEEDLYREELEHQMYVAVLAQWTGARLPVPALEFRRLKLLPILFEEIPDDYFKLMESRGDRRMQLEYGVRMAALKKDWGRVRDLSMELIKSYPTYYYHYWLAAQAAVELGERERAIAWLKTYTKHSKNDLDYPKAVKLLESLQQDPSPEPVPQN